MIRSISIQLRPFLRYFMLGIRPLNLGRHPPELAIPVPPWLRLHTAVAHLILRFTAIFIPLITLIWIVSRIGSAPMGIRFSTSALVLGALWFACLIGGRVLYKYAAGRYEATRTHDLMKIVVGAKGPVGEYLRDIPMFPIHLAGLSVEAPSSPGWHIAAADRRGKSTGLAFAWFPDSRDERRRWQDSKSTVRVAIVIAQPAGGAVQDPALMLGAFADQIARRMSDDEHRAVEGEYIDLDCRQDGRDWLIRGRYGRRTLSADRPCLAFQHEFKMFRHSDGESLVQITAVSRLPCDHQQDFSAELVAAVDGVRLLTPLTAVKDSSPSMTASSPTR